MPRCSHLNLYKRHLDTLDRIAGPQVDFVKEAQHIAHFANYLDTMGMRATATCPYVYKHLSSQRLLVLEYLDGVPLTDLEVCSKIRGTCRSCAFAYNAASMAVSTSQRA